MPEVDYLLKDPIIPDDQKFCCMSLWLSDDKKTIKYIRVSASFKTIEEAQEQVALLGNNKGHFNFCTEVGAWVAFDPLPNRGNLNDQLNLMMKNYLISFQRKNLEFEKRKHSMVIKNISENRSLKEEQLNRLNEELREFTNQDSPNEKEIEKRKEIIKSFEESIKSYTDKIKEHEDKEKEYNEKLQNIVLDLQNIPEENTEENQNKPFIFEGQVKRTTEKLDNQNWYCISFLTEENKSLVGIKISGCFNKESEANNHSKALRDINDKFSILVGELYKWCPFNPDADSQEAGESEYSNDKLNETMKAKKDNEKKAQMFHEFRKYELINKNLQDSLVNKNNEKEEIKKNIENETSTENKLSYQEKLLELEKQIEKLEVKKTEVTEKEKELSDKIGFDKMKENYNAGIDSVKT